MTSTPPSKRKLPVWRPRTGLAGLLSALVVLATPATAHDTWWAPTAEAAVLALGTGNRFPLHEYPLGMEQLRLQGCRGESVAVVPLQHVADMPTALWLRAPPAVHSCWAQTLPLDITIDDALVEVYFNEIAAGPELRERRAEQRLRGVRWHERYVKHARIELDDIGEGGGAPLHTAAVDALGLDVRLQASRRPLRVGDTVRFQVLRDGQPLPGLPVQFRSDLSPLGFWRTTDAHGMVSMALPLAARWVLRGVDLRPAADSPDHWESRFVTLAFDVRPTAPAMPLTRQ